MDTAAARVDAIVDVLIEMTEKLGFDWTWRGALSLLGPVINRHGFPGLPRSLEDRLSKRLVQFHFPIHAEPGEQQAWLQNLCGADLPPLRKLWFALGSRINHRLACAWTESDAHELASRLSAGLWDRLELGRDFQAAGTPLSLRVMNNDRGKGE